MTRIILLCSILVVCVGTFIYLYKRFKLDIISGGILFMVILGVYLGILYHYLKIVLISQ